MRWSYRKETSVLACKSRRKALCAFIDTVHLTSPLNLSYTFAATLMMTSCC